MHRFSKEIKEILYDINGGRLSYEFTKILDPNKSCLTLVATDVTIEENREVNKEQEKVVLINS